MPPAFGTSGLRGLVADLTPGLVAAHVLAFARACPTGGALFVGRDLRPSSPGIAAAVAAAGRAAGLEVTDCGALPTPALALAATGAGAAAVMVTGSHIPADRNGLKFYTPAGEITKADEAAILAALGPPREVPAATGVRHRTGAGADWAARAVRAWGPSALAGRRIGVWSHSAVGRDLLIATLRSLGAETREFGRSETFVPVDTEAVDTEARAQLATWAEQARAEGRPLDAIVSMDGDGDRPLLTDAGGRVIPGDILGQIAAAELGATRVVTPVSSNSGAEAGGRFAGVTRTRIGSPFVIAGMAAARAADPAARVAGYEANGGFLLGFAAAGPAGPLPALTTRDSLLPIVAVLVAAGPGGVAARVAAEPARFTAADRLTGVPAAVSQALVARLEGDPAALRDFLAGAGIAAPVAATDRTDGLRLTAGADILHLRPSGNAPELRLYTEAATPARAGALLRSGLTALRTLIR